MPTPSSERHPVTFGYASAATRAALATMTETIRKYCATNKLPPLHHVFAECTPKSTPLLDRVAAKRLLNALRRGDHLVAVSADCMFASLPQAMRELLGLRRMGIQTHIMDWDNTPLSPIHAEFVGTANAIIATADKFQPGQTHRKPPYFLTTAAGLAPTPDTVIAQWVLAELHTGKNIAHVRKALNEAWWTAEIGRLKSWPHLLWVTGVFASEQEANAYANGGITGRCVPSVRSRKCVCTSTPCSQCGGTGFLLRPFSRSISLNRLHKFKRATHHWTWPTPAPHFQVHKPGLPLIIADYLHKEKP